MLVMLYNCFIYFLLLLFLLYIKMSEIADLTYYQKIWNVTLNKAKDYYKNNEQRLKEQGRDKYRSLSVEEKVKRENRGRIGIIIYLREIEKKQRLKEYSKILLQDKKFST